MSPPVRLTNVAARRRTIPRESEACPRDSGSVRPMRTLTSVPHAACSQPRKEYLTPERTSTLPVWTLLAGRSSNALAHLEAIRYFQSGCYPQDGGSEAVTCPCLRTGLRTLCYGVRYVLWTISGSAYLSVALWNLLRCGIRLPCRLSGLDQSLSGNLP